MTRAKNPIQAIAFAVVAAFIGMCGWQVAHAQTALPSPTVPAMTATSANEVTPNTQEAKPAAPPSTLPVESTITDEHYRLGAGDKVRVTVYGETDLSGEFLVNGSGQVELPLVGQVPAAGLTLHEFTQEIRNALLNGYLTDPKVSVEVEDYRPFFIMGEVNKPGEYPYQDGLTIQSAVALAGGYTFRADDSDVYIRHSGSTKEQSMPTDSSTKINPGDIIRVPERLF